jgi:hypothetical protein
MPPWMLEAPNVPRSVGAEQAFKAVWAARDLTLLPGEIPRWVFLQWLTEQGYLLHGSEQPGISGFEPRTPFDLSPDEFSKRSGVFAASDALWAMMYALRDRTRVARTLNMGLQVRQGAVWSAPRYFLSFAPRHWDMTDGGVTDGHSLLSPGVVYVLPAEGFERMPPYDWPGVGQVLEAHWVSPAPVTPLWSVPVSPADFPLPVRLHDAARVDVLSGHDPWGFPWLEDSD